jgi:hypothetical protein
MYSVSSGYVSSIKARVRNALIYRGTLTLIDGTVYTFENKDIDASSGVITRKCSSDYSIDIGGVYAAELVISLIPNSQTLDINRYKLYGAIINLFCEITALPVLTWGDASSYQWNELIAVKWGDNPKTPKANIPLGEFVVSESMRSANAIKITAYDYMTKFDKNLPVLDDSSRTIFNWIRVICNDCGVACGMTLDEVTRMTNGNRKPNFSNVDDTVKTYRDLLACIAQATASVALIDRYGRLILKQYSMTVADTIDAGSRYSSDFSDYQSYYTGLSATYKSQGVTEYYTNDTLYDDGLSYEIGCNPFLQISNDTNRKTVLQGIIDAQTDIKYTPFKVEIPSNPLYDLMDVLEFTDNQTAEEDIAPITSLVYHLGDKTEIACNGADPALSDAVIKENRTEESLVNYVESDLSSNTLWMVVGSFPERQSVIPKDVQFEVASLSFYAIKEKNVIQIAFTATYVLDGTSLINTYVYVDNNLVYQTKENQWPQENRIALTTGYEVNGKGNHTAKVIVVITDSTLDIGGGGVLMEKNISETGLYIASDEGVYGYSKVTAILGRQMGFYGGVETVSPPNGTFMASIDLNDYSFYTEAGIGDLSGNIAESDFDIDFLSFYSESGDNHYSVILVESDTNNDYLTFSSSGSARLIDMNAQRTDIDAFGNVVTFLNQNGIVIQSSDVLNGVASAGGYEYSAGYEGFNILLGNLDEDSIYVVSFDFQTISGAWNGDYYVFGYRIYPNAYTSYPYYNKASAKYDMWDEMERDLEKHSYVMPFVALKESMYLVFAFPNYSDSGRNYFEITNLKVSRLG